MLAPDQKLPMNITVAYDLSRYACQLSKFTKAFRWLQHAKQLSEPHKFKEMTRRDPDLEPLWEHTPK